ncbi:MAG: alpha-L-fucosidase [Anaerocolumna sp.]
MYFKYDIPKEFEWFPQSRYGLFIHWGPYSMTGHGEQALFRDHMDQSEYEKMACSWNPLKYNPKEWAKIIKASGFKYACLTTRHHDGYCLWDSEYTDYTSMKQAPKRDFVKEYTDALREEGLKVGLYYSWCDWRIPAYYEGPNKNPEGWIKMQEYIHNQVRELCSKYGKIDYFFFDGVWPRCAEDLKSHELVSKMREWQPGIIINNRLGYSTDKDQLLKHGGGSEEGDFGTPEHLVNPENRLWESNQVSYWRWWGYTSGERWKSASELLDTLCTCASKGGNLIMNIGPTPDGEFQQEFQERAFAIGRWLDKYGESIYGSEGGELTEALTYGFQTMKGNNLYLIIRFWDGKPVFRFADLTNRVSQVELMTTKTNLNFRQEGDILYIEGLPEKTEESLFPVIKITCEGKPETNSWGEERLWEGDPQRVADWAVKRGNNVNFHVNK